MEIQKGYKGAGVDSFLKQSRESCTHYRAEPPDMKVGTQTSAAMKTGEVGGKFINNIED